MDSIKKNIKNIINQDKSTQNKEDDTEANTKSKVMGIFILVFIGLWVLLGVVGFIHSLICLGYDSTFTDKVLGLIIALLFGPFFYVYYYFNKSYCGRKDIRENTSFNAKYNNMNRSNTNISRQSNILNKPKNNTNNKGFFKNLFTQLDKNNTNKPVNNQRNNNKPVNNLLNNQRNKNKPVNNLLNNQRNNNKPVNNLLNNQRNKNKPVNNSLNQKNNNLMKNSLNRKNNNRPVNKIEQL